MLKNIHWSRYLPFSLLAAIVYCLPLVFFLKEASYTQSWLLYLGNFLYLSVIVLFLINFNHRRHDNAGTTTMLAAGMITTVLGIAIAILLGLALLLVFIPGLFNSPAAGKELLHTPANMTHGNTNGLVAEVLAGATLGNFAVGFFASIIFPFTLKGDQSKESAAPNERTL